MGNFGFWGLDCGWGGCGWGGPGRGWGGGGWGGLFFCGWGVWGVCVGGWWGGELWVGGVGVLGFCGGGGSVGGLFRVQWCMSTVMFSFFLPIVIQVQISLRPLVYQLGDKLPARAVLSFQVFKVAFPCSSPPRSFHALLWVRSLIGPRRWVFQVFFVSPFLLCS